MLALESTFWICLGKCAQWLLEIQDSRNRLSEWGDLMVEKRGESPHTHPVCRPGCCSPRDPRTQECTKPLKLWDQLAHGFSTISWPSLFSTISWPLWPYYG